MIRYHTPARKIIEKVLIEHSQYGNKYKKNIVYNQFLPYSKKYLKDWIDGHLFGPQKVLVTNSIEFIKVPFSYKPKYKDLDSDLWKIIHDPGIREQIEINLMFGYNINDTHNRLASKIHPRKVNLTAIKQYQYFFLEF